MVAGATPRAGGWRPSSTWARQTARPDWGRDLELLGRAAYLLGRDDEYVDALERAHEQWVRMGEAPRAARCAFWIGHSLLFRGRGARAQGWFSVGHRLLKDTTAWRPATS